MFSVWLFLLLVASLEWLLLSGAFIEQARLGLSVTSVTLSVTAGLTCVILAWTFSRSVADRSPHFWTYTWVGIADPRVLLTAGFLSCTEGALLLDAKPPLTHE